MKMNFAKWLLQIFVHSKHLFDVKHDECRFLPLIFPLKYIYFDHALLANFSSETLYK